MNKFVLRTWRIRYFWHRWSHTAAYIILAAGTTLAIALGFQNASNDRDALRDSARTVVMESCGRDNETRAEFRSILRESIENINRLEEERALTPPQSDRAIAVNQRAIERLGPVDCQEAAAKITDEVNE